MKLSTQGYSRVLVLRLTIIFLNTVPKIPFLSKFGLANAEYFDLNETRYIGDWKSVGSEFNNCFLKFRPCNSSFEQI